MANRIFRRVAAEIASSAVGANIVKNLDTRGRKAGTLELTRLFTNQGVVAV